MVQTTEISKFPSAPTSDGKTGRRGSSLRPPTLMIDLLFGALMLFAFQMGYVDKAVVATTINIPTSSPNGDKEPKQAFPITPVKGPKGIWKFKIAGGKILSTTEVVKHLKKSRKTPLIVLSGQTSIQNYLDASAVLRHHGFKAALAVKNSKG